eukprot:206388_1
MTTKEDKVPHISHIQTKFMDYIKNGNTPIAAFLQAKLGVAVSQDNELPDETSIIRIIPNETPIGNDLEPEPIFDDTKLAGKETNKKTAIKSMRKMIVSQNKMIDKLMKHLKDRKLDYNKKLQKTKKSHEIEVNELRIKIGRLNEENKEIKSLNIQLKNKLSKYAKIMNPKRSKKLPTLPIKHKKSQSMPPSAQKEKKSKKINLSIASLSLKLSKSTDEIKHNIYASFSANDSKLKKYQTMKKLGIPIQSIINTMKMDQCSDELIAEFKGEKVNDNRFTKYKRMNKMNIPHKTIINKMRMDGFSKEDIDAFKQQILGQKKKK